MNAKGGGNVAEPASVGALLAAATALPVDRTDAELLLAALLRLPRAQLIAFEERPVDMLTLALFQAGLERLADGEPLAYVTGVKEFWSLPVTVAPGVLVPRPETELLVEWALASLDRFDHRRVRAVDVGSGSGAIAVALAALSPEPLDVTAIEPSPGARSVIERNRDELLPGDRHSRFRIVADDLLTDTDGSFELVLANLPYLTPEQIAGNPDLDAEPRMALDGGADGLDLVRRLIAQLPGRVADAYAIGLELDPSQVRLVVSLLEEALPGTDVSIIRDYAGLDRHVVATRFQD